MGAPLPYGKIQKSDVRSSSGVAGRIHSVETGGMVDGPGLRYVVFLQGCPLRCRYCHNPDTWNASGGRTADSRQVVAEALRYRSYLEASGGGLTVSGGEPLFQPDFTKDIIIRAREQGLHTAVDTSGFSPQGRVVEVLKEADLVLLDIKTLDGEKHRTLTGVSNAGILPAAEELVRAGLRLWIRHVIVPGFTDSEEDIRSLADWARGLGGVERVDLLPFHQLGAHKWQALGLRYTLEDLRPPSRDVMDRLNTILAEKGFDENGLTLSER